MRYHECPDCGATLDPGERCDCHKQMTVMECSEIYHATKGDPYSMICAAYKIGYQKAEKNAAQDAGTSTDGNNAAKGHETQLKSTTPTGAMQGRRLL